MLGQKGTYPPTHPPPIYNSPSHPPPHPPPHTELEIREAGGQLLLLSALKKEKREWEEEKERLRQDLDVARSNQERGVEGLRQELREAQAVLDETKAQHAGWVRQAQRREAE